MANAANAVTITFRPHRIRVWNANTADREDDRMEAFMELFGGYEILGLTVYKWGLIIAALIFVWNIGGKVIRRIKTLLDAYQKREEELQKALQQVAQYPKWREQSIEIQEKINKQLTELAKKQTETSEKLDEMEKDRKAGELNKLQAQLLSSYHYYTNKYKNPQLAWSRMESKSFWDSFGDYEKLGGDGFMHSEVQPAMNRLEEIEMDDTERLVELYASRKS